MISSQAPPQSAISIDAAPSNRSVFLRILVVAFGARVGLQILGSIALASRGELRAPSDLLQIWVAWDAHAYLRVARSGYPTIGQDALDIVFFPLYPFLVRGVSYVLRDPVVSALVISTASAVGAGWFLYRLVRLDADHAAAQRAVVLLFAFPTAYYLMAPYTEALFLLAVVASMYAARSGTWSGAGAAGAVATATRFTGVILGPALAVEALSGRPSTTRFLSRLAWASLAACGILAYLAINVAVYGDPLAFVRAQGANWHNRPAWPWVPLVDAVQRIASGPGSTNMAIIHWGRILGTIFGVGLLVLGWRKLRPADHVYGWIGIVLLLSSAWLISLPRYLLGLYPLFIVLGRVSRRGVVFWGVLGVSVVLQGFFFWRYALGQWTF